MVDRITEIELKQKEINDLKEELIQLKKSSHNACKCFNRFLWKHSEILTVKSSSARIDAET